MKNHGLLINGELLQTENLLDVINPATEEVLRLYLEQNERL